jgi:hypothetical protein
MGRLKKLIGFYKRKSDVPNRLKAQNRIDVSRRWTYKYLRGACCEKPFSTFG